MIPAEAITIKDLFIGGIYFWIRGEQVLYVGRSSGVIGRVGNHEMIKRKGFMEGDVVKFLPIPDKEKRAEEENRYIQELRPMYNNSGRLFNRPPVKPIAGLDYLLTPRINSRKK